LSTVFTNRESGNLGKIIGSDLWKAFVGVVVSLGDRAEHPTSGATHRRLNPSG
jgi:hypothetical protein